MADEEKLEDQEGKAGTDGGGEEHNDGANAPEGDDDVKDKHGQPGINKERHDKEVAELTAEIEKLKAEAKEAAETKEGQKAMEKKVADLESKLEDQKVSHALEMAGCKNEKAAKALLDDYDGDVSKLKAECPYLFEDGKPRGKTGGKPAGSVGKSIDDKIDAAFGVKKG